MNRALATCLFLAACAAARGSDRSVLAATTAGWFRTQGGMGEAPFVRGFEIRETIEFVSDNVTYNVHMVKAANGHFRCEVIRPDGGTLVQAWDGRLGWEAVPELGLGLVSSFSPYLWITQGDLLLPAHAFPVGSKFTLVGREDVDGQTCVVGKTLLPDKVEETCWFDLIGRRLLRARCPLPDRRVVTDDFGDFQTVGGLKVPFVVVTTLGDTVVIQRRSSVSFNPHFDEASVVLTTAQVDEALAVGVILKRHDASIRGDDSKAPIHTRIIRMKVETPTNGVTFTQTISQKMPNLILEETSAPGMGMKVRGFDGTTGWEASDLQGFRTLKPSELAQLRFGEGIHMLAPTTLNYPLRRRVQDRVVDGRAADGIALASEAATAGIFYFDKENGHLLRVALPSTGDRTNTTEAAVEYSDFRAEDGLDIPHSVVQQNALFRTISTVTSIEINAPLDEALFRPRRDD